MGLAVQCDELVTDVTCCKIGAPSYFHQSRQSSKDSSQECCDEGYIRGMLLVGIIPTWNLRFPRNLLFCCAPPKSHRSGW
jgi:hypothetical protein